ncbi:hypothetical protein ACFZBM_31095 [Streptomyces lavendulae]|uniref:Uncharacterized protein n=1 Tax=Streptomyces lavendulae subsp. lavendulae TaxID=58340 RepID=A0A2K8PRM3_STRLA|nr:hypothetical protein [Streptomyces lavendulae]ATZ29108.1 hypothetical protein SLAV_36715 [Streptomyces lavendulae subsp. lavendulae]QUQ58928.1 hypothetical protein SLLC_34885 [Streptomyces lavendulae subsp. lavendulae]
MTATPETATTATPATRSRRDAQAGPPPGILAVVFTALFLAGLVLSTLLADGDTFPSPFGSSDTVTSYFRDHTGAVRLSGALQFAASVPLAIYAATVSARLHKLGVRAPGATIALAGGVLASAFLTCSGLVTWVLSRPEVADHAELVRALQYLAFGLGGPAHVVLLGLLIAGIAVPGLLAGLLPRALAVTGLAVAAIAELSTLVLLADGAALLLPVARFAGLLWLIAAGFLLPRRRVRTEG